MAQYLPPEDLRVGNGVETVFGFTFPYLQPADIAVTVDGVKITTVLVGTAQVSINPAPADGAAIRIYRDTPAQFPAHLFSGGIPMLPRYIDDNNRQLLYALQEGLTYFQHVEDASNEAREIAEAASAAATEALESTRRAVRAPLTDPTINPMPSAAARVGRMLSFDAAGNPVAVIPISGEIGDFAMDLINGLVPGKGAGMVGYDGTTVEQFLNDLRDTVNGALGASLIPTAVRDVANIAALSALPPGCVSASVQGYYAPGDQGGGMFRRVAGSTTAIDGGRVFAANGGGRWFRVYNGPLSLRHWGCRGDNVTDDTPGFLACVASGLPFLVTQGQYCVAPIGPPVSPPHPGGREPNRTSAAILSSKQSVFGFGDSCELVWKGPAGVPVQAFFKAANATDIVLANIKFTGGYAAIAIDPVSDYSVRNVGLSGCTLDGQLLGIIGGRQLALDAAQSKICQDIWLDNCHILNTAVHGVMITNCWRPRVTNCRFGNLQGGFAVDFSQGCRGGIVANNQATNVKYFMKAESSHIDLNSNPLATDPSVTQSHTTVVTGNVATDVQEQAVFLNSGVQRFVVTNNVFRGSFTRAIALGQVTGSTGYGLTTIAHNVIEMASVNAVGVYGYSDTGTEPILVAYNQIAGGTNSIFWASGKGRIMGNTLTALDNVIQIVATNVSLLDIIDNQIRGGAGIISPSTGMWRRVRIRGNTMYLTSGFAVYLPTITGFQLGEVHNNTINRTVVQANPAVLINLFMNSRFTDNTINLMTGSGAAARLSTTTTDCIISRNITTGAITAEGQAGGTAANLKDNIINAAYVAA